MLEVHSTYTYKEKVIGCEIGSSARIADACAVQINSDVISQSLVPTVHIVIHTA